VGQPVLHFEVIGKDGPRLQKYYADLFGWKIDANNPMHYGMVDGRDNPAARKPRRRRRYRRRP
jgi:predicted enzyme related to lactoylglutathione lyase